jgi:hypothetical protein
VKSYRILWFNFDWTLRARHENSINYCHWKEFTEKFGLKRKKRNLKPPKFYSTRKISLCEFPAPFLVSKLSIKFWIFCWEFSNKVWLLCRSKKSDSFLHDSRLLLLRLSVKEYLISNERVIVRLDGQCLSHKGLSYILEKWLRCFFAAVIFQSFWLYVELVVVPEWIHKRQQ